MRPPYSFSPRRLRPSPLFTLALCAGLAVSALASHGPGDPARPEQPAATTKTAPVAGASKGVDAARHISVTSAPEGTAPAVVPAPSTSTAAAAPASAASSAWYNNVQLTGQVFFDYAYYAKTGFGPQFLTQMNQEGPGNNDFNSFDVTRAYVNVLINPKGAISARITPNIYRQVDNSGAEPYGNGAQIGSSSNGNLGFRLKYAYVQFNHLFTGSDAFSKDAVTIGQTTNPLVDWEEALWGYRYIALVPWNYLSLSSTYVGASLHGPIMRNDRAVLDYDVGVFNETSFHHIEKAKGKSVMGRLTWYPLGTKVDRTGFGLTVFDAAGASNVSPDTASTRNNTFAALAHYTTTDKAYGVAAELDMGENAFGAGNLFSGVGPVTTAGAPYANWNTNVVSNVLSGETRQRGYDFFGHARLGHTPATFVFFFQHFQPNIHVANDPLDFDRLVLGVSFHVNKNLDLAVSNQNLFYTQPQGTYNGVANAVPSNTNAIMLNAQYNF